MKSVDELKDETWVLCYIINDAINFFHKLGVLPEFMSEVNPYFKPTLDKVIKILQGCVELKKEHPELFFKLEE